MVRPVTLSDTECYVLSHGIAKTGDLTMFILGIQGSPRGEKSRTRMLMEWVLAGAGEAGATVKLINCTDLTIIPCSACEACRSTGRCVHDDDISEIYDLLISADGVVLGSPVYLDHISGQMKIALDRLSDAVHYQILGGRYGCSVATTYISGGDEVVQYLDHIINYLGAVAIKGLSVRSRTILMQFCGQNRQHGSGKETGQGDWREAILP